MKKIVLIVATMALTLVSSCNKELNTDITTPSNSETHELFVSLPKLMDAETKATIAEADGGFSWTAGDFIAVKTSTNDVYKFTAAGSGNSVRFTYTGEMNGAPTTVVYPYTDDATVAALPTEITGLTGALGEVGIRLSGTVSDNAVSMDYENAFLKVSFTNVPTFASSIVFDGTANDVTINGLSLDVKKTVTAYIPASVNNTGFTISLKDNAGNTIVSKATTTAKSFSPGTLKSMKAIVLGSCLQFSGSNKANVVKVKCTQKTSDTDGFGDNNYTWEANTLTNGNKYIVLPDPAVWQWLEEDVDAVRVDVYDSSNNWIATTNNLYLRDIEFTVESGSNEMQAPYRYYYSKPGDWSQINIYTWDENDVKCTGDWPGSKMTNTTSGRYYYEFSTADSDNHYRHVIFSNNGENQTSNIYRKLTQDFYGTSTNC